MSGGLRGTVGQERVTSACAVAALHIACAWLLVSGSAADIVTRTSETLRVVSIAPEPPPPAVDLRQPEREPSPSEGKASPANVKARAVPVVVPPARVPVEVPEPVRAAPAAGAGEEEAAGASERPGPQSGGGGSGAGTGSGNSGSGTGSGGDGASPIAARAQLSSGRIAPRDYPRAANGDQGTVVTRLAVSAAGAVTGCSVTRSSGNDVLDAATCRLIRERFRFTPARDAQGRAVADVKGWQQSWWRERER